MVACPAGRAREHEQQVAGAGRREDRSCDSVWIIAFQGEEHGIRPGVAGERGEHQAIRLRGLSRAERLSGRAQLVAGGQDRDARPGADADGAVSAGGSQAELVRPETPAGSQHDCAPGMSSPAGRTYWPTVTGARAMMP